MPTNPPANMPRITSNVFSDDLAAALEFLGKAFGFETRMSIPGPDGGVMHAEMQVADGVIMMSPTGGKEEWRSPRSLDGAVTQSLYVYVDALDEHCERARAAGAEIIEEPANQPYGDRRYGACDPEGHNWYFASRA